MARLITVEQAAELLQKSPASIRRRIRLGRIRARNIGTDHRPEYRIPSAQFDAA